MFSSAISRFWLFMVLCSFTMLVSGEVVADQWEAGTHYTLVAKPQPPGGTKPEILEVFNFKCPHCEKLRPVFAEWAEQNKKNYNIKATPIYWGKQTDKPLKALYAAQYMGKGEEMKHAIFTAFFARKQDIENENILTILAQDIGLDITEFRNNMKSFGVLAKVGQGSRLASALGVHSTPTIVVNRTYQVTLNHAEGNEKRFFTIIEDLAHRK